MKYRIEEIEVTRPLPRIQLRPDEDGVAILLRYDGRPAAFWMEAWTSASEIPARHLREQISRHAAEYVLKERIRRELVAEHESPAPLPPLTIAICTHDRPERLKRCLDSLRPYHGMPGIQVLVVDNAPSDARTRDLVAGYPAVDYVMEHRAGLNFARNRALLEAEGELLAFLDDDVVVAGYWLDGLREACGDNPDAGCFTGLVLPYALETEAQVLFEQAGGFRRGFRKIRYHGQHLDGNPLYPCGAGIFGAGANMVLRRDLLRKLEGFDAALDTGAPLPGGGDLDIFYRVIRSGAPLVYEPAMAVYHEHRRDLDALLRQYWSWGLGFMAFVERSYRADPEMRSRFARLVLWWLRNQVRQTVKSMTGRHELPPRMLLAELRGGLRGLAGEYGRSMRRVSRIEAQGIRVREPAAVA